jgi:hypothetical protein
MWAAYRWTGDKKYVQPFLDEGPIALRSFTTNLLDRFNLREAWGKDILATAAGVAAAPSSMPVSFDDPSLHFAWQVSGDVHFLEKLYGNQIEAAADREYINTEGSLWIDRNYFNSTELQRARLGGVALMRNYIYPGHVVSWNFQAPANDQSVAILIPESISDHVKIIAYNLDRAPVKARMTGWDIDPGKWEISQGTQLPGQAALQDVSTRTVEFERSRDIEIAFPPRTTTVLELKLTAKGVPYWSRPDLGVTSDDVTVEGNRMKVTVHSVGAVDAPAAKLVLRDRNGKTLASADVPPLKAPVDLLPKTAAVALTLPAKADWKGGSLTVETSGQLPEITQMNNRVQF